MDAQKARFHVLKLNKRWFKDVAEGRKDFEVRFNDRDFQVGDTLVLNEVDTSGFETYLTGNTITAEVTYILTADDFPAGLQPGYVVMAIRIRNPGD